MRARAATVAEVSATVNAIEGPLARTMAASSYGVVAVFLPAVLLIWPLGAGRMPSRAAALGICVLAGVYAVIRWAIHAPLVRYSARRTHTEDITERADDVGEDGKILAPGKYEGSLRILAVAAALLSAVWVAVIVSRIPGFLSFYGLAATVLQLVFVAFAGSLVGSAIGRARGKVIGNARGRNRSDLWSSLGLSNVVLASNLDWSKGATHRALYLVTALSLVVAVVGWQLEKKRGK